MATIAVSQLLYLLDDAFDGTEWNSLLGNLGSVTADDWEWVPPGGERSIRDIVQHVGACKFMYEDHAFGAAKLGWDDPLVEGGEAWGRSRRRWRGCGRDRGACGGASRRWMTESSAARG
jgi:hypothetical protein